MSKAKIEKIERIAQEAENKAGNALSVAHTAGRMAESVDFRLAKLLDVLSEAGVIDVSEVMNLLGGEPGDVFEDIPTPMPLEMTAEEAHALTVGTIDRVLDEAALEFRVMPPCEDEAHAFPEPTTSPEAAPIVEDDPQDLVQPTAAQTAVVAAAAEAAMSKERLCRKCWHDRKLPEPPKDMLPSEPAKCDGCSWRATLMPVSAAVYPEVVEAEPADNAALDGF